MTKTLTEQWKDLELPEGLYYFNTRYDNIFIGYPRERNMFRAIDDGLFDESDKIEVIAPVPSYKEYNKLRKLPLKCFQLEEDNSALMVINKDMCKELERLQEQLNEANEVIKWYAQPDTGSAKDYLEKWGVK